MHFLLLILLLQFIGVLEGACAVLGSILKALFGGDE